MIHETDLPCSDCGSALEERTVQLSELLKDEATSEQVTVAHCPDCGAKYYPERTLSKLFADHEPHLQGGG